MRIVLELLNGPQKGRKIRLSANQTITVGRTEWSDFVIPADQLLSGKHFALEADRQNCQIRDLNSANGTCVNGAPSKLATLKSGDRIIAGESQFLVIIDGGMASTDVAPTTAFVRPSAVAASRQASARSSEAEITVQPLRSGLYHARGLIAELPPLDLAERLMQTNPMHLIVDFGRLGQPRPEGALASPLFDWLPDTSADAGPMVISPCELARSAPLIEAAWGCDSIICLYSGELPSDLVNHLRAEARAPHNKVVGYCWPGVLAPLLANYRKDRARQLMDKIGAVLVEDQDEPEYWQVFSLRNLQTVFERIGLRTISPGVSPSDS